MAHFAEIDVNNIVLRVCVVNDTHEADGVNWCANFWGGIWVQTSYNTSGGVNSRGAPARGKNYAGVGMTYDAARAAFIAPTPYPSWVLDEDKARWKAPVDKPTNGKDYVWDETVPNWVERPV